MELLMNMELYGTLRILRFVGLSVGIVLLGLQHLTLSRTSCIVCVRVTVHSFRGRAHTNLWRVDRIRSAGYAEDTVQWTTDTAEETDSQLDSTSDSEILARNDSSFDVDWYWRRPTRVCPNGLGFDPKPVEVSVCQRNTPLNKATQISVSVTLLEFALHERDWLVYPSYRFNSCRVYGQSAWCYGFCFVQFTAIVTSRLTVEHNNW